MLSALTRALASTALLLSIAACAAGSGRSGHYRGYDDERREFLPFDDSQFVTLYAAQDWQGAAARVEELTQQYRPVVTLLDVDAAWTMVEACERANRLDGAARVLIALSTSRNSFEAPLELRRFAKAHGLEVLERNGAFDGNKLIDVWFSMSRLVDEGQWAAARELFETEYSDGEYGPCLERIFSQVFLGDMLREAGRYEAALAEYTLAAYAESLHSGPGDSVGDQNAIVLSVRIECLLYEMGEPSWALDAMKNINPKYPLLEHHGLATKHDKTLRAQLDADVQHFTSGDLYSREIATLASPNLRETLAALRGVEVVERTDDVIRYEAKELSLRFAVSKERVEVESTRPEHDTTTRAGHDIGRFTTNWDVELVPTLNYFEWASLPPAPPRCVRIFGDGSVFVGSPGFESQGVLLFPDREPYVGVGRFGRPPEEALRAIHFFERTTIPGRPIDGLGERTRFAARTADQSVLFGEGYVDGDRLVPDGPVRLTTGQDTWYAGHFTLGVAGPWRRCGTLFTKSDLSAITDVFGNLVPWMSPGEWAESMERMKSDRLAEQRRLDEKRLAEQIAWDAAQKAYWDSEYAVRESRGGNGGSGAPLSTCYMCDGTGMVSKGGGMESYSGWVTDGAGVSHYVSGSRWVPSERVTCDYCGGAGER